MAKELSGEEKFLYLKKTAWKHNTRNWSELKQEDREAVEQAYVAQKIEEDKAPKVAPKEEPKKVKGLQEKGFDKPTEEAIVDSSEDSIESGSEEAVSEEAPEASGSDEVHGESDEAPELPDPVVTNKSKPKKTKSRF